MIYYVSAVSLSYVMLYYVSVVIFFIVECGIVHFLCTACIRSSGIILTPYATFLQNFISFVAFVTELDHEEQLHTHSLNQSPSLFDVPGTEALGLRRVKKNPGFIKKPNSAGFWVFPH